MFCHTCGCSNRPERSSPDDREIRSNAFIDAGFISFFSITKNSWNILQGNVIRKQFLEIICTFSLGLTFF
jgi:hypothetical protein